MSTYTTRSIDDDDTGSQPESEDEEVLEECRRCYKLALAATSKQREREKEDLRFQVAEFQWDEEARRARQGGTVGNQVVPARPILSISLVKQPLQLVKNQAAAADLGVNIHAVSEKAEDDLAEIKQGLYRRIERDSGAEQVRLWALDRATQCGMGWYIIRTQWDEDGDDPFDQEISIQRILDQGSVFIDPSAYKPDFSDANWAFLTSWVPLEDFKRQYPDSKAAQEETGVLEWETMSQTAPEWVHMDNGGGRAIQIAEYWYKEHNEETICLLEDGKLVRKEEVKGRRILKQRSRDKVTLKWYKVTGQEVIDREICEGTKIPLIPVVGIELQPFDSERRFEGMIRPARDGQRLYNVAASTMVEMMLSEPKAPFIADPKAIEGYENWWQQANTRNFPYLPYNAIINGQVVPPPERAQKDMAGMSISTIALNEGKGFVQSTTAVYDPSLGETPKHGQSGRAVIAQQQQSDAGTSNYLQNLANISMPYEAQVILELMPSVYDRSGRVTQILGGEDEKPKKVMLNKPFVQGPDGNPMPAIVPPGTPMPQGTKHYDLSEGKYTVSVSVGKSYQTRLQQGQDVLTELMPHLPPEFQIAALPTMMKFMDTPGAKELAQTFEKLRDMKFPGLTDDENQQPTPDQLQTQIKAMEQKGQEVGHQLQGAIEQIKTDQAKQQAMIAKAQIDAQKEITLQKMKDATSIAVAQINASVKIGQQATEAQNEAAATGLEHQHEAEQAEIDRQHEAMMAQMGAQQASEQAGQDQAAQTQQTQMGQAHEAGMAAQGQSHDAEQADADRQAAAQQPTGE